MKLYLGCDPGAKGAFALIDGDTVSFFGMPMVAAKTGQDIDAAAVWQYFRDTQLNRAIGVVFVLEQSNPRPGEGRSSGAKLAWCKGVVWGQAVASRFAVQKVAPAVWKKAFGLIGCDKKSSRAKACELFPSEAAFLTKARPDFSEALLLAEWARRADR